MIRIEPTTSVTPPNIPQPPAPAKPGFKGYDRPDTFDLQQSREEYQNLSTETSGILSKIGKAGFLILTGLIAYKTTKWGLAVIEKQVVKALNAEKIQKILSKISDFAKDKVAVKAKALGAGILNFGKEKVVPFARKAFDSFKKLKVVNSISDKASDITGALSQKRFARKGKVALWKFKKGKLNAFIKSASAKIWDFSKGKAVKAKESIPTGQQIKELGFNTVAFATGFAAALQGADIANSDSLNEAD